MIGELLAATCDDPSVLARIGGRFGEAARDAASELAELDVAAARSWRVRLIAAARAPIPPGVRGVHPSWIEAALAGLPSRVRGALAVPHPDPVDIWLMRSACASLPPLPPTDPEASLGSIEDVARLGPAALASWLADTGADQLAFALRAKPDALRAIATSLGETDRLVAAVRRITKPPRAGALGSARDALARCRGDASADLLMLIGARAIAPHTDPLLRRQLAVRLPRPRGLAILDELTRHASDPIERAPAWEALAAARSRP